MIVIQDKKHCCGCTACQQICPQKSIEMHEDKEGFLYPTVNTSSCTDCHLCEKICPVINRYKSAPQPECYGAKTRDESLRSASSSGGAFTILATKIIEQEGVVFGAKFMDDWSVAHDYTETIDGLAAFRGSKYIQSRLGDTFTKVRSFLKDGRLVLFTGTPCQVSGLNHFLRKKYDNLFTIDMVCHSISSPKVWKMYLSEIKSDNIVTGVTFRDKESFGWRNYGLKVSGVNNNQPINIVCGGHNDDENADIFMRAFCHDLTTRPSCSACPERNYTSGSDLMLADFWHLDKYHQNWDDNKGMSEILALTDKGKKLLDSVKDKMFCSSIPYSEVEDTAIHAPITTSCKPNRFRAQFFYNIDNVNVLDNLHYCMQKSDHYDSLYNLASKLYRVTGLIYVKSLCRKVIGK